MIGKYLPQINKSATVAKFKILLHLNKALGAISLEIMWPPVPASTTSRQAGNQVMMILLYGKVIEQWLIPI